MYFAVLADDRIKLKESKKKDRYLDLARELKHLWNMNVTVIPVITSAPGTIPIGFIKELEVLEMRGQIETIQT